MSILHCLTSECLSYLISVWGMNIETSAEFFFNDLRYYLAISSLFLHRGTYTHIFVTFTVEAMNSFCHPAPASLSPVNLKNMKLGTTMKCEDHRHCSLHLSVKANLQLNGKSEDFIGDVDNNWGLLFSGRACTENPSSTSRDLGRTHVFPGKLLHMREGETQGILWVLRNPFG